MKETIAAGGSFLVSGIQSTGISFGLDRLESISKLTSDSDLENKKTLVISINQDKKSIELADKLRKNNIACSIFSNKISKALDYANSYKIPYVIFIGEQEIKKGKFKLRDMKAGKEMLLSEEEVVKRLG